MIDGILNKKTETVTGKKYRIGDEFVKNDFVDKGSDGVFIRHDPLLRVAKKIMGIRNRSVNVIQTPSKDNQWSATVTVSYTFGDENISWESSADARTSSLNNNMDLYTTAMAETRASARALRFALGVEVCSFDELGPKNMDEKIESSSVKIEATQLHIIKTKFIEQSGITIEEVTKLAGINDIKELKNISRAEGTALFTKLNKLSNRKNK